MNPTLDSRAGSRLLRTALVVAGLFAGNFLQAKTHLRISLAGATYDAFTNWTESSSWEKIDNYENRNAIRPVVDLILQLKALRAGGLDFDFELERTLTYESAKQAVIEGKADLTAETIWDDEIAPHADSLLSTAPVLQKGEFVKGVYVLPTNERLLKVTTIDGLKDATAAVVSTWALDVKTLSAMPIKGVQKFATPELAYQAIKKEQADFMLDEFSSQPDLRVERAFVRLVPIPGIKVAINGSRSWIVSKQSPDAAAIFKALSEGLASLRKNGVMQQAYTQSGFFNPKVADWKQIF
jgi:hypothetical protein